MHMPDVGFQLHQQQGIFQGYKFKQVVKIPSKKAVHGQLKKLDIRFLLIL